MDKLAIKYGLILGGLGILLQALLYVAGVETMTTWWVGILSLILLITVYFVFAFRYRKDKGGYLTFKEAFIAVFTICVVSGIVSMLFSIVLNTVIDPSLPQKIQAATLEKTITMMQKFDAPQEKIDEVTEKIENAPSEYTLMGQLKKILGAILMYAIFSLIIAAIVKRKRSEFEEPTNSNSPTNAI